MTYALITVKTELSNYNEKDREHLNYIGNSFKFLQKDCVVYLHLILILISVGIMYQYFVKIVPTIYRKLNGEVGCESVSFLPYF